MADLKLSKMTDGADEAGQALRGRKVTKPAELESFRRRTESE